MSRGKFMVANYCDDITTQPFVVNIKVASPFYQEHISRITVMPRKEAECTVRHIFDGEVLDIWLSYEDLGTMSVIDLLKKYGMYEQIVLKSKSHDAGSYPSAHARAMYEVYMTTLMFLFAHGNNYAGVFRNLLYAKDTNMFNALENFGKACQTIDDAIIHAQHVRDAICNDIGAIVPDDKFYSLTKTQLTEYLYNENYVYCPTKVCFCNGKGDCDNA